jgi:GH35 family endo-1,4-beta-xylanase
MGDPKAVLTYNDFDMELNTPEHERRRNALLLLLDDLQHCNTPIDAIGSQSHLKYQGFLRLMTTATDPFWLTSPLAV